MKEKKYVKISIDELARLIEGSTTFKALEYGGVNNWEWYGESLSDYISEYEQYKYFDDYIDDITSEENILKKYPLVD